MANRFHDDLGGEILPVVEEQNPAPVEHRFAHARAFRNEAIDMRVPHKGAVRVYVNEKLRFERDGATNEWTVSGKAYADEWMALSLAMAMSNPTLRKDVLIGLAQTIDAMDERAVKKHGYSHSEAEKAYEWCSVAQMLSK